jgi:hypothetical protein
MSRVKRRTIGVPPERRSSRQGIAFSTRSRSVMRVDSSASVARSAASRLGRIAASSRSM